MTYRSVSMTSLSLYICVPLLAARRPLQAVTKLKIKMGIGYWNFGLAGYWVLGLWACWVLGIKV